MLFVNLCISLIIYFVRGSVSKYVCSDVNSNVTTNEIYKDARNLYYGKDLIYSLTHFNVFGHSFFSMLYCFEMKKNSWVALTVTTVTYLEKSWFSSKTCWKKVIDFLLPSSQLQTIVLIQCQLHSKTTSEGDSKIKVFIEILRWMPMDDLLDNLFIIRLYF